MRIRILSLFTVLTLALVLSAPPAAADMVKFKTGAELEGVIKKVEAGMVFVQIGNEEKTFNILDIESMDFNTPHLLAGAASVPLEHFLKDIEAQEIVLNIEQLEKTATEIQKKLGQIRMHWAARQPITAAELPGWEAAKEEFGKPLSRYQELLNDTYFHVLSQVDEYNLMATEASKVYVGVKGIRSGSPLVSKDMAKLPLKKYVPATWWDTIFYEGYNRGYDDAYEKFAPPKTSQ